MLVRDIYNKSSWAKVCVWVRKRWCYCDRKSRAAYAQSFALWQQATIEFTCHDHSVIVCSRHIYVWCCSSRTSRSWWITQSTQHHWRGCNNIPSFLQRTAPIARSLCEGWTRHDLHILVTAPFYCDRKSRAAYAQSFALWQQATIEFTCHDHSIIACSRQIYVWCRSSRTSRSWWITQSTQHHWRGCNGVIFMCVHVYDVALCGNTIRYVAVGLWLVGHPWHKWLKHYILYFLENDNLKTA